jgi:hypothetical protein
MRGLILPSQKNVVDWDYAQDSLSTVDDATFLEILVMGRTRTVYSHLIVPTCMCLFLDEQRNRTMARVISEAPLSYVPVLLKQDSIISSCAFCSHPIRTDNLRPFQMAVRLIGAADNKTMAWTYDVLLGILCRTCETHKWRSLLPVSEASYLGIAQVIADYGFRESMCVEQFVDSDRFGPDPFDVASMALSESYLARLIKVNDVAAAAIAYIMADQSDAAICGHCGRASHTNVMACAECNAVSFCSTPSFDTRLGPSVTCFALGQIYHGLVCKEIREGHLFYIEHARYITRKGACIPFFDLSDAADSHLL